MGSVPLERMKSSSPSSVIHFGEAVLSHFEFARRAWYGALGAPEHLSGRPQRIFPRTIDRRLSRYERIRVTVMRLTPSLTLDLALVLTCERGSNDAGLPRFRGVELPLAGMGRFGEFSLHPSQSLA